MISTRRYLEELRRGDRERTVTFFSIALAAVAFTWSELKRRYDDIAKDTSRRRDFEEGRFSTIENAQREATAKAQGAQEAAKAAKEAREEGWRPSEHIAAIAGAGAAVLLVIATVLAYTHALG